jgi:hypothetical protein
MVYWYHLDLDLDHFNDCHYHYHGNILIMIMDVGILTMFFLGYINIYHYTEVSWVMWVNHLQKFPASFIKKPRKTCYCFEKGNVWCRSDWCRKDRSSSELKTLISSSFRILQVYSPQWKLYSYISYIKTSHRLEWASVTIPDGFAQAILTTVAPASLPWWAEPLLCTTRRTIASWSSLVAGCRKITTTF